MSTSAASKAPSVGHARSIRKPTAAQAWSALDRALERARAHFDGATACESLGCYLTTIREAVRGRVSGESAAELALPRTALAVRVLQRLRRDLVDEVRDGAPEESCLAIEILAALGDMESRLERAVPAASRWGDAVTREALDLVVEMAHDMRSPLCTILFLADILQSGHSGPITSAQAKQLALIYTAARGLEGVANDLIDHARGHDRLIGPRPVAFSVTEILHEVRDIIAPMAEESLKMSIAAPVAHARFGFPVALKRVLLNLASNAVKYTPSGRVEIGARELSDTRLEFSVTDSGPGIPKQVLREIFEPFRGVAGPAERVRFSSSGLGLSIARRLVAALGGQLKVMTNPDRGTRFLFELELPRADVT